MDTHPGVGNVCASSTKCTVPLAVPSFAGRWRVETGQEVVLCHNPGQNILWSWPQAGREDLAGYCSVEGGCYVTILANCGGIEQRLGIVENLEGCLRIHWFQNNTKPLGAMCSGVSPDLLVRLHIRLASSMSCHKSVWQFVGPEDCRWNCTAVLRYAFVHLQVMRQRRPRCARMIDNVTDVMCATLLIMVVWLSILGIQEAAVALTCNILSQSMGKDNIEQVQWHIRLNFELLLFICVLLLHPLRFSMSPVMLALISQLAGLLAGRIFRILPEHAPSCFRVVYGIILGLTVTLRILLMFLFHFPQRATSRADPLSWPGVRILEEEQREVVIGGFLADCHNAFEVEDVFAVDKQENMIIRAAQSDMPMMHTRRLYQSTSAVALKVSMIEDQSRPLCLHRFGWISKTWSFLIRASLVGHKPVFGMGIYLAANPHQCFAQEKNTCIRPSTGCRFILACDVLLGRTRELRSAAPHLTPELMSLRSVEGLVYDSVTGLDIESGGDAGKKEFVVYDPSKVTPKYIFCVRNKSLQQSRSAVDPVSSL